jgi:peptidoglycan hydrolase-like amidase
LTHRGRPAFTQFASSSGGWTSAGGQPYLVAKRDPWDDWAGNPMHSWTTTIDTARLESIYPRLGQLERIRVTRREGHGQGGGRILTAVLVGSSGRVQVTGDTLRSAYGLRSTWWTVD